MSLTDLNKIAEDIIKKQVGINPGSADRTPMDYGECKLCIIAALQDSGMVKALEEIRDMKLTEEESSKNEYKFAFNRCWHIAVKRYLETIKTYENKVDKNRRSVPQDCRGALIRICSNCGK